ncbi:MAG: alpha/beta fold hydrolase [Elusimicrobiales bacterium]|jgi:pimeloyl-ACP methyl ester carboxylesterase
MKRIVVVLCFVLAAAAPKTSAPASVPVETVHFRTADGCVLEGSYRAPSPGSYVFLNVHGLGSDKSEWAALESGLKRRGYGFLSLDLRGHGGSLRCSGRPVSYISFSQARWAGVSEDIRSAADLLKSRKVPENRLVLCGASVGANLALKALAEGLRPAGLVLLSPGLSYAGIEAETFLPVSGAAPLLLAASEDDTYAWQSSGRLLARAGARGIPAVFRAGPGGHGANMLSAAKPELLNYILDWAGKLRK